MQAILFHERVAFLYLCAGNGKNYAKWDMT